MSTGEKHTSPALLYSIVGGVVIALLIAGWFGFRMLIAPFQQHRVTLVDAPKDVAVGTIATFTWRIDGPATTIPHTAVHFGTISTLGELGTDVSPSNTRYSEFVKDFANGSYAIPLQFVGNISFANRGVYYYRVHALAGEKNYWSDEYVLEVKAVSYGVRVIDYPREIIAGAITTFTWRVDGLPTTIPSTSIYFGRNTQQGALEKDVRPQDTLYTSMISDFARGSYAVPLQFVGNVDVATPGAYFFRGHAVIHGENYWTDELTFDVVRQEEPSLPARISEAVSEDVLEIQQNDGFSSEQ